MTGPAADPILYAARIAAGRGAWSEARAALEADYGNTAQDGTRAMLLGEACLRTGDPSSATEWLARAAPLLVHSGNRPAQRSAANMQGAAAFALGTLESAEGHFGAALEMAQADGDALLTARATNNLGAIDALRGDADRAIAAYQLAIPSYQRLGNAQGLAESWHNLGISLRSRGELNAADDAERRAIEFAIESGNARLTAMGQIGRAEISLRRGDFAWARATAARAVHVFSAVPDYLLLSDALRVLADACDRLGLRFESDESSANALRLSREHGHRTQEAQTLQTCAQIQAHRGDLTSARSFGEAAREAFSLLGSVTAAEEMSEFLARLSR
jgi:tetratricopeptide (TPR) repeat protein